MGGAKRYPSSFETVGDGFREGLNPSYAPTAIYQRRSLSQIFRAPKPKSLARNNKREAAKAINAPLAACK
jgi:hypothetical protein